MVPVFVALQTNEEWWEEPLHTNILSTSLLQDGKYKASVPCPSTAITSSEANSLSYLWLSNYASTSSFQRQPALLSPANMKPICHTCSCLSAKAISTLFTESCLTGAEPTNLKHTNKENGYNQQTLHPYTKMLQCNPLLHTNSEHQ